jgi:hypothetical protein
MKINLVGWKKEETSTKQDTKKSYNKKNCLKRIKKNNKKLILKNIFSNKSMKKITKKSLINKNITHKLISGKKTMKNSKSLKPEKHSKNNKS